MIGGRWTLWLFSLGTLLFARVALAEPSPFEIGDSSNALPGIVRVPMAGKTERLGFGAAATAGYGYTGSVVSDGDKSHRAFGSLAASYRALDWLAFALRFDGRYDGHTGVPGGNGGGAVGEPGIWIRAGTTAGDFRLGAELRVAAPGGKAPSLRFDAISPELSLLGAYAPISSPMALSSRVGFRLDRSSETASEADRLGLADRMSLGVSDTNALLLGLGFVGRVAKTMEALAEWTWDVRVPGKGADLAQSPMRIDAGARFLLSDAFSFQGLLEVSPSARPPVGPGAPLVVIEPRVSAFVGVNYRPSAPVAPIVAKPDIAPPPVQQVATGRVRGRVSDDGGHPIAGAKVEFGPPVNDKPAVESETDERGEFDRADLPVGKLDLKIAAEGYRPQTRTVDVGKGDAPVEVKLERALPVGQIRGLARSFNGEPIRGATVRIEPIGKELQVGQGGRFEVDVPPGEYDVIVKAAGYADQQRHVRVEANGVVVLDLDMRTRR